MSATHRWLLSVLFLILLASCSPRQPAHVPDTQTAEDYQRSLVLEAGRYVGGLSEQGLLPGFRTGDRGFLHVSGEGIWDGQGRLLKREIAFPVTLTVYAYLTNVVSSATNAYYVTKESRTSGWHLDGAWRWEKGDFVELGTPQAEGAAQTDERLWVEARINGKPAHLAIDTAADDLGLFAEAAVRLGLSFTNAPKDARLGPGQVLAGTTEDCDVLFSGTSYRTSLRVLEIPAELDMDIDGVVGWSQLRSSTIRIDACQGTVTWLSNLPGDVTNWTKVEIETNSEVLRLKAPSRRGNPSIIVVDTGDTHGARLSPNQWRDWKAAHTNQPMTLASYYNPFAGIVVAEEAWAKELPIGPVLLKGVPVMEADKASIVFGSTTLGLAALKRLELIIDGKNGIAYLRARETPPPAYEHNRLGAVFVPLDFQSQDLIGHVVEGSPAWEAGIRNGDVLLRIGELDATKWRTDPAVRSKRFRTLPPGTKLELTLRRGKDVFKANVVLRQILSPETSSSVNVTHE